MSIWKNKDAIEAHKQEKQTRRQMEDIEDFRFHQTHSAPVSYGREWLHQMKRATEDVSDFAMEAIESAHTKWSMNKTKGGKSYQTLGDDSGTDQFGKAPAGNARRGQQNKNSFVEQMKQDRRNEFINQTAMFYL